jgi:GxxExxY protein
MDKNFGASAPPRFGGQKSEWQFPHSGLTDRILGAAIHVHRQLGPGFLEKMYENALCLEFAKRGLPFARQVPARVSYDGVEIGMHRLDLIVEGKVVVELKAVKDIEDVHLATVLSYLKATSLEAGLILNYAAAKLRIRRVVRTANWTAEARRGGSAEEESKDH